MSGMGLVAEELNTSVRTTNGGLLQYKHLLLLVIYLSFLCCFPRYDLDQQSKNLRDCLTPRHYIKSAMIDSETYIMIINQTFVKWQSKKFLHYHPR